MHQNIRTKAGLVYLIFPLILASVLYLIFISASNFSEPERFSWIFFIYEILLFYTYLAATLVVEKVLTRFNENRYSIVRHTIIFILALAISLVISLMSYYLIKSAFIVIYSQNDVIGLYHLTLRCLTSFVGFILVYSVYFSISYFSEILRNQLREEQFKSEKMELQYKLLYSKIDPHFLFNNLNTLHSLIQERDETADDFVVSLSRIMRYSLSTQEDYRISLNLELQTLFDYMIIMKSRFGNELSFQVSGDFNRKNLIVPMSILSLVENAIKHNEISEGKQLTIDIHLTEDNVMVGNNKNPKLKSNTDSNKSGLKNLKEMYSLRFGSEISIEDSNSYFKVSIPYIK